MHTATERHAAPGDVWRTGEALFSTADHDEYRRRLAAAIALLRDVSNVDDLRDLVTALIQAAAIWFDLEGCGYRRTGDGGFDLAAASGPDAGGAPRRIHRPVVAAHGDLARISAAADLDDLGYSDSAGELLWLRLPSGDDPLWILTFRGDAADLAEPVLRALAPVLDLLVDRWQLRQLAAVHDAVLSAVTTAPAGLGLEHGLAALARRVGADGARILLRASDGFSVAAALPDQPSTSGERHVDTFSLPLSIRGDAIGVLELTGVRDECFAAVDAGRRALQVWLAGAMAHAAAHPSHRPPTDMPDLLSRARDAVESAESSDRTPAVLAISFIGHGRSGSDDYRRAGMQIISRELRAGDAAGVLPGADLAVLLDAPGPDAVLLATARLRRVLRAASDALLIPPAVVGLACFPGDGATGEELAAAALREAARQSAERQKNPPAPVRNTPGFGEAGATPGGADL